VGGLDQIAEIRVLCESINGLVNSLGVPVERLRLVGYDTVAGWGLSTLPAVKIPSYWRADGCNADFPVIYAIYLLTPPDCPLHAVEKAATANRDVSMLLLRFYM
jgi:hypothetical protein